MCLLSQIRGALNSYATTHQVRFGSCCIARDAQYQCFCLRRGEPSVDAPVTLSAAERVRAQSSVVSCVGAALEFSEDLSKVAAEAKYQFYDRGVAVLINSFGSPVAISVFSDNRDNAEKLMGAALFAAHELNRSGCTVDHQFYTSIQALREDPAFYNILVGCDFAF